MKKILSFKELKSNLQFALTTATVFIVGLAGVFTAMKKFFNIDLLDSINNSLSKKQFAEAYGVVCGFENDYTPNNADLDFSTGTTNVPINSTSPTSLPFDFYYTGKKYNSIYLNNTQLFNISDTEEFAVRSQFSFDGLGVDSKSYFTNDLRSQTYANGSYYNWNMGLPINTANNLNIDNIKSKTFGTSPNSSFGVEFNISPSQAGPGPVDRLTPSDQEFSSTVYAPGQWGWNNKTVITNGLPIDIYVLQDKGDINLDNVSITAVTVNGTKGNAVKDISNKKIRYTPNIGQIGDDTFTYTYTDGNGNTNTEVVTVKLGSITGNVATLNGNNYSSPELHQDIVVVNPNDTTINFNPLRNDILNDDGDQYEILLTFQNAPFEPWNITGDGSNTIVNQAIINSDNSITINTSDLDRTAIRYQVMKNGFSQGLSDLNFIYLPDNNIKHGIALQEANGKFGSYTKAVAENSLVNEQNTIAFSKGIGYNTSNLNAEETLETNDGGTNLNEINSFDQINCAVEAADDSSSVTLGSSVNINVLENDADYEYYKSGVDSPVTVTIDSPPSYGTAVVNSDNTITYTSTLPYSGDDYFSYKVVDTARYGQVETESIGYVNIAIDNNPVTNQPPTVTSFSKSTNQDTILTFTSTDFTTNYSDPENTPLSKVKITQLPTNGTLKLNGVNVALNQEIDTIDLANLTFEPNTSYVGTDLIKWNATDGTDYAQTPANVNITVNAVTQNQPPTANQDNTNTNYNTPKLIDVITNDTDPEDPNNLLTVCVGSLSATGGTVTLGTDNRTITFTPTNNSTTAGSFTYKACDSEGLESLPVTSTVSINNTPPTITSFAKSTNQNTDITFASTDFTSHYNDTENTPLSKVKITQLPANGTLKLNGVDVVLNQEIDSFDLSTLTYVPVTNFTGSDLVKWNATDGSDFALSAADININIIPVVDSPSNQPPTANADPTTTPLNTPFTKDIVTNDTDPEDPNNLLTVCVGSLSATGGTVTLGSNNRTITFTPTLGSTTAGSFTYKACDSENLESLPVTSVVTILNPVAIQIDIKKNKQDIDIFPNTTIGFEVKTTNPNSFSDDIVTTIKIDTNKLQLKNNTVKEGVLSDLGQNNLLSIDAFAQNDATIEIISPSEIKVTYPNMLANSSKTIVFEAVSLVPGSTEVSGIAKMVSQNNAEAEAETKLLVESQQVNVFTLARTGGWPAFSMTGILVAVAIILYFLAIRKKTIENL
jgi:hypothetical protein